MLTRRHFLTITAATVTTPALAQEDARPLRLALVVARAGDDYYVGCRQGALEAAAEVAGAQMSFLAPPVEEAARQAALIDDLVKQGYDAILLSPIPSDVVIAACDKAVRAGTRVISFDTALPPEVRQLHLQTPDTSLAAANMLQIINTALGKAGEVALVSTSPERADHKDFAKALQREWLKPDYENLVLITSVFAKSDLRRAYAETLAIVQAYPNLRGIIAPDAAALMGAARAVRDLGRGQSIKLTGIGLPSRLAGPVREGLIPAFVTWSPVEVGYAAARIALSVLRNEEAILANAPLKAGRLGELTVDKGGVAKVAELITIDPATLDKYADLF
jgi:rhamnose transport system substrate-binding protein